MDLPSAYRYMRLCAGRPVPSKPLRHARLLLTNTLPPVRIDDAAAAAHDAAAHSVTLAHLPAELLDEEMLLDQLLEFGSVDALTRLHANEYVCTFETAEGAAAAVAAEAEAAASAAIAAAAAAVPQEPWLRRAASEPEMGRHEQGGDASSSGAIMAPLPSGGASALLGSSGCLSGGGGGLSKKKTIKRVSSVGGLTTPGTGRRVISFGSMDDPTSAAPERRERYTLPGGRPAFSPGWDANIEVTDAESELEDTRGDAVSFSLTVDGAELVTKAPVVLSGTGDFATLRLPSAAAIDPRRAAIACVLALVSDSEKENAASRLATANTSPPMELSAWNSCADAQRSLTVEKDGFTVSFVAEGEAAAWNDVDSGCANGCATPSCQSSGVQLVAVRVRRA